MVVSLTYRSTSPAWAFFSSSINLHKKNTMPYLKKLEHHIAHVDRLMNIANKAELAECARLLAMNVAHYQMRYGKLPLDETLAMIDVPAPNNEQLELVANGMETMAAVLGSVMHGLDGETEH
ncbi:hypothetical protein SAMN05720354_11192 [Nitrosospira sp. Nsp1]|nr:hypothetical protein SAMN05720354_11192 [Nitrosospira sp. Nsp1]